MSTAILRLIASPDPKRPGRFTACLESTREEIVGSSRQPLVDSARELIARGFDPATPLTMRMDGKTYDSFQPLPIGQWAKWTYAERDRGIAVERWQPRQLTAEGQNSGSEAEADIGRPPEANSLLREAPHSPATIQAREDMGAASGA